MRRFWFAPVLILALHCAVAAQAENAPRLLGAPSCASTSCHGGAGERNQNVVWSRLDYHSRSYATLTSTRSERFTAVLNLGNATTNARCTTCHAPFASVDAALGMPKAAPSPGVSCESCHGPAASWLRSPTRPMLIASPRACATSIICTSALIPASPVIKRSIRNSPPRVILN